MREKTIDDIVKRVQLSFSNKNYLRRIESSKARWLDKDVPVIADAIIETLQHCGK